ncbi:hypothetical protein [Spirosoma areae]
MKTIREKEIKFLLKDSRSNRPTLIYLIYGYGGGRFKYSIEQTTDLYQWDTDAQRARNRTYTAG